MSDCRVKHFTNLGFNFSHNLFNAEYLAHKLWRGTALQKGPSASVQWLLKCSPSNFKLLPTFLFLPIKMRQKSLTRNLTSDFYPHTGALSGNTNLTPLSWFVPAYRTSCLLTAKQNLMENTPKTLRCILKLPLVKALPTLRQSITVLQDLKIRRYFPTLNLSFPCYKFKNVSFVYNFPRTWKAAWCPHTSLWSCLPEKITAMPPQIFKLNNSIISTFSRKKKNYVFFTSLTIFLILLPNSLEFTWITNLNQPLTMKTRLVNPATYPTVKQFPLIAFICNFN